MKYYKLTLRFGGDENEVSVDYFDSLDLMCDHIWHAGAKGFPCFQKADEISEQEYRMNYLPV